MGASGCVLRAQMLLNSRKPKKNEGMDAVGREAFCLIIYSISLHLASAAILAAI